MDYAELQEKFPFLSCVRYANNEYVGILQNQDQFVLINTQIALKDYFLT